MDRLIDGYRKFRGAVWPERRALFEELARSGQTPYALVIACSDSRVDPSLIFNVGPGELFVVRNVANLVPPYQPDGAYHGTSAALEFAVTALRVPHVIVLGHGMCGGIGLLLRGEATPSDFLGPWMSLAARARERALACVAVDDPTGEAAHRACEDETVRLSLENLRTFPWVAEAEAAETLRLHGCSFDIRTGILRRLGPDGVFAGVEG